MATLQTDRILNFTSTLGADVLLPEFLAGAEGISELFYYQVELVAEVDKTIDPKSIIGTKVTVGILADDSGTQRYINGIVASFESSGGDDEYNNYRVYIVPNIWLLTINKNTRVFQDMTVIDVIKQVLSNYNISPAVDTSNNYPTLEYCTQYRETDFAFISRLMEQHGILYYFKHTSDDHTFTLQDISPKLSACPIQSTFRYTPQGQESEGFYDFVISGLQSRSSMVTGNFTAWDYGFVPYAASIDKQTTRNPLGENKHESYDYGDSAAAYLKKIGSQGKIPDLLSAFNYLRQQAGDAECVIVEGISNAIAMQTGYNFTLTEYPQAAVNTKYLITRVEHSVRQTPPYRTRSTATTAPYSNSFTAIPFATMFRPQRRTSKPVVNGMHTGLVVVPSGEDSYMDKYGRVCVQFFWDRLRKPNTTDNTLLRVAQSWAGKGWGTYFWPRIDDEVLIDFMEGDPDQPIVVGSVYNGVNMPKYDPAGQYTLSGILTRSSKGGGAANANELRFEDLDGKEQVFMNAERDYDLHVEHDHHTLIGAQQHEQIGDDHYMQTTGDTHLHIKKKLYEQVDDEVHQNMKAKQIIAVGADRHESISSNAVLKVGSDQNINVGSNLNEKIGSNYSLNVGMNQYNKVGMVYVVDSGQEVHIKGGMNVVIEGGLGVCMKGPGGFVSIDPSGVTIQGMLVKINSGGAALSGSPAQTQDPTAPDSPTAPKDPSFPGDAPPSQPATSQAGAAPASPKINDASPSSSTPSTPPAAPPPTPAAAAASAASGAANQAQQATQQATQQAAQAAQQAATQADQFANQAQQAANQAQQQAQQAVQQVTQEARQAYQQANQAVSQAQQAVSQAAAQGQAAAQQAMNQAQAAAQQTAQQAAAAVQQAQQKAQQVEQQAQQAAQQAQQQAQQAAQQAQQAAQAAEQQAQQAANQAQQQGQQAVQQAQQAAQQAQQQAQQAAKQAQQAAQQAQQQAQQAASQVQGAAQQATQQAQQAAQQAQQSAQQAIGQAMKGF
jgi:type VI secretion system secreted protein VgrG